MYGAFGFHLFGLLASGSGGNVFISPASIAMALAIVTNGAAGETRTAMQRVLGVQTVSMETFDNDNAQLITELRNPGSDLQFSIANALWLNPRFSLEPQFVKTSADVFDASARTLQFGEPSAAKTINDWVDQHTNGRIPEIVDSTSPMDALVVTNAVAMKAKWVDPFEKSETHDQPFTTGAGKQITVSMMHRTGEFAYAQNADWQIAKLPYKGDRFAMFVFLPRKGLALHDVLKKMNAGAFDSAIQQLKDERVIFGLPRFTATYKVNLNETLSSMGMQRAFDPAEADFSGMVGMGQRAYISDVVHRAFVRVDEEGTEAAAATAITMRATAIMLPQGVEMIVDRPFLMAIRDEKAGEVLFLGTISNPEAVQ